MVSWLELGDYLKDVFSDNKRTTPCEAWECLRAILVGGKRKHLNLDVGRNHARYMEEAGFVDIRRREY